MGFLHLSSRRIISFCALLMALITPAASVADPSPDASVSPPAMQIDTCAAKMQSVESDRPEVVEANRGECEYAQKNLGAAVAAYTHIGNELIADAVVLITYDGNVVPLPASFLFWHEALCYEKMGKLHDARAAIAKANLYNSRSGEETPNVALHHDFRRLDGAQYDRHIDALVSNTLVKIKSENAKFAQALSGDEHDVALSNGRPCHVTRSENATGVIEIWYYDCQVEGGAPKETFTFRNGRQIDHTTY